MFEGVISSYSYNASDYIISNGISVNYAYNDQKLLLIISRNQMNYNFTYNGFNELVQTKVGVNILPTNHYNAIGNIDETSYENSNC